MMKLFFIGFLLLFIVTFIIIWPMMIVASRADDEMEKMYNKENK